MKDKWGVCDQDFNDIRRSLTALWRHSFTNAEP